MLSLQNEQKKYEKNSAQTSSEQERKKESFSLKKIAMPPKNTKNPTLPWRWEKLTKRSSHSYFHTLAQNLIGLYDLLSPMDPVFDLAINVMQACLSFSYQTPYTAK